VASILWTLCCSSFEVPLPKLDLIPLFVRPDEFFGSGTERLIQSTLLDDAGAEAFVVSNQLLKVLPRGWLIDWACKIQVISCVTMNLIAFRYGNLEMSNISAGAILFTGVVSIIFFVIASLKTDTKGLIESSIEHPDENS